MAEIRGKSDFTKWCYFSRMTPENITPVKSRCGRTAYCYLFAPLIQVCSDNETPFTLPEPISVDQHDTVTTHHHQQQHQQVLESRDHSDWPADATHTQTNGVRHAVHTSSRPSSVKVSHVWRWVCAWLIVKYLKCFVGNRYRLILVISHLRMQSSISRRGCRLGPKGAAPSPPCGFLPGPQFCHRCRYRYVAEFLFDKKAMVTLNWHYCGVLDAFVHESLMHSCIFTLQGWF